jgi:hypothetical protein
MTFATVGCRWISKISNGIREPVMIAFREPQTNPFG